MSYASSTKSRYAASSVEELVSCILALSPSGQWHLLDKVVGKVPGWSIKERPPPRSRVASLR
jgi:hypothetical protein